MLSEKQQTAIEQLILQRIQEIRAVYEKELPSVANQLLEKTLDFIRHLKSPQEIDRLLEKAPKDAATSIKILAKMQFAETAAQLLPFIREPNQAPDPRADMFLSVDFVAKSKSVLNTYLHIMQKPADIVNDKTSAYTINQGHQGAINLQQTTHNLSTMNKEVQGKTHIPEQSQRKDAGVMRDAKVPTSKISEADKKIWIENSPFKADIEKIQKHINELDSLPIPAAKEKAGKLKEAFNAALDALIQGKIKNMDQFLKFKKEGSSIGSSVHSDLYKKPQSIESLIAQPVVLGKTPKMG